MFGYGEPGPQRIQEYKEISEMIRNFISKQFLENSDEKIDPFRTMFNHEEMITINSVSFLKTDLATTEFLFELAKKAKETASDFLPIIAAHPNVNDEIICYLLSDSEKHEAWGNLLKRKDITKNQVRILASIENKFGCTGLVYIAGSRFVNDFLDQISNQFNLSSFEKLLVKKKENYIRVGCFGDVVGNLFSNEVVSNEFLRTYLPLIKLGAKNNLSMGIYSMYSNPNLSADILDFLHPLAGPQEQRWIEKLPNYKRYTVAS